MIVHAGLIARRIQGDWTGALIEGPSGAGKSDLALRCLDIGFRLVADDRVRLFRSEGALFGRAPPALAGLIEVRGLGVIGRPFLPFCRVALLVVCGAEENRVPEPSWDLRLGLPLRRVRLVPLEPSAPAKLCHALEPLGAGAHRDYERAFRAGNVAQRVAETTG